MTDKRFILLQRGQTCVANRKTDNDLIEWAKEKGMYTYIGRRNRGYKIYADSPWHNPFKVGRDAGTNEEACEMYRDYLLAKPELLSRLEELRGKLLVCWCYPKPCHGDVLIELLNK